MDLGLDGKSVIVLGAGAEGNMGQSIARNFAAEGARVMVAGRTEGSLPTLAREICGAWTLCNITSKADNDMLVDRTVAAFGSVDVVVNASGYSVMKPMLETTQAEVERLSAVQFIGPFLLFQSVIRAMTDGGSIIQITSATAKIMLDDHAPYRGTKAATDQVIRSIANEFGERGIRANSVAPGLTDSPMGAEAFASPAIIDLFSRETPMGRPCKPADIADACLWLASDRCFMTGQTLQVNGGITLRRNPRSSEIMAAAMGAAGPG
jgi:2-hydroxycyclohexanecarboxyl-CoA dehydrogenase